MGHHGSRGGGRGTGSRQGGELTGVELPMTRILELGLLSDYDGFSGIIGRRCRVTGGFPIERVSSGVGSAELTGVYSVF